MLTFFFFLDDLGDQFFRHLSQMRTCGLRGLSPQFSNSSKNHVHLTLAAVLLPVHTSGRQCRDRLS